MASFDHREVLEQRSRLGFTDHLRLWGGLVLFASADFLPDRLDSENNTNAITLVGALIAADGLNKYYQVWKSTKAKSMISDNPY